MIFNGVFFLNGDTDGYGRESRLGEVWDGYDQDTMNAILEELIYLGEKVQYQRFQ